MVILSLICYISVLVAFPFNQGARNVQGLAYIYEPGIAIMNKELRTLLDSYPAKVKHTDIVDLVNFEDRLSAVDCLVVNTIDVSGEFVAFIPDNEPPLKDEVFCWIWAIRPDLSRDLLNLDISEDFSILLNAYIDGDMGRFWDHMS